MVLQTRKALEEYGGKVTSEVRGKIESALSNLEVDHQGRGQGRHPGRHERAGEGQHGAGQGHVRGCGQEGLIHGRDQARGRRGPSGKDDVIDAEFKVKDE